MKDEILGYACIVLLIAFLGAAVTAAIYRGDDIRDKDALSSLKASYKTAAVAAETHAAAISAQQTADLQRQTQAAIEQAQAQANNAQSQLRAYQAKLAAAATVKDLGHRCAGVEIPKELLP